MNKTTSLDVIFDRLEMLDPALLKDFQGELKSLSKANYQKLRNQLEREGFAEPVTAFELKGEYYLLNGHQRIRTILMMRSEGVQVPLIPVNLVKVRDRKHAKKLVLGLTSQFGEITAEGLSDFCIDSEIDMSWINDHTRFPEASLDLSSLTDEVESDVEKPVNDPCPTCGKPRTP